MWNSSITQITGQTGTAGTGPTYLSSPSDVTFDTYEYMYVVDTSNHRIQQYPPGINEIVLIKINK